MRYIIQRQGSDFECKSQLAHTIALQMLGNAPAPYPQEEKGVLEAYPTPSPDPVALQHALDDFPDGGLQAWLVVLGVRP
jgi:hypothetical protein